MKHSFRPRRTTNGSSGAANAADLQPVPRKQHKHPTIHTSYPRPPLMELGFPFPEPNTDGHWSQYKSISSAAISLLCITSNCKLFQYLINRPVSVICWVLQDWVCRWIAIVVAQTVEPAWYYFCTQVAWGEGCGDPPPLLSLSRGASLLVAFCLCVQHVWHWVALCDPVWPCVTLCDPVWLRLTAFCLCVWHVWHWVTLCKPVWPYVTLCDPVWLLELSSDWLMKLKSL